MPVSSDIQNACDGVLSIDDSAGSLVDVTGVANSIDMSRLIDIAEFNVFGSTYRQRLWCKKDATLSLEIYFSTTVDEGADILEEWYENPGARTVRWDMPDSTAGSWRYEGEFLISTLDFSASADEAGPVVFSAELVITGDLGVVRSTIAS